jgi:hypothetical protein
MISKYWRFPSAIYNKWISIAIVPIAIAPQSVEREVRYPQKDARTFNATPVTNIKMPSSRVKGDCPISLCQQLQLSVINSL